MIDWISKVADMVCGRRLLDAPDEPWTIKGREYIRSRKPSFDSNIELTVPSLYYVFGGTFAMLREVGYHNATISLHSDSRVMSTVEPDDLPAIVVNTGKACRFTIQNGDELVYEGTVGEQHSGADMILPSTCLVIGEAVTPFKLTLQGWQRS